VVDGTPKGWQQLLATPLSAGSFERLEGTLASASSIGESARSSLILQVFEISKGATIL
jgi:hypothetical protein